MDDAAVVAGKVMEVGGEVDGEAVASIDAVLRPVAGGWGSDTMVARASGAGAAQVSLVAIEQWTPVAASLLQQAHSPVVAL
jgi:hypothetical protein